MRTLRLAPLALILAACGNSTTSTPTKVSGPAPDVTSIAPGKSPLDGGGWALVKGLGFQANASVTVGGAASVSVVVVDGQTLSFQVPSGRPGPADVVVQNADGGKRTVAAGITYEAPTGSPPQLSHVSPNSGPSAGGTFAKIEGQGIAEGAIVLVGGAPASLTTFLSPALMTGRLPGHTGSGSADVILINPDGQTAALFGGFGFSATLSAPSPKITDVQPDEGPLAGGSRATVATNNVTATSLLFFGGKPTDFDVAAGGVSAQVPAGKTHGLVDVAVTNADGQSDILFGAYNYTTGHVTVPPSLSRVSPAAAPPAGGATVLIEGAGFAAGAQVLFGTAVSQSVTVVGPTVLTAVVPPSPLEGGVGPVDVTVQNDDGGAVTFRNGFNYRATSSTAPTLTSVSPNTGPTSGGTVAEVDGTGLLDGALVFVGGRPANSVVVVTSGVLTARFPALPAGAADVTVTNPDGQSATLRSSFTVSNTSANGPRVNRVTPATGSLEGGTSAFVSGDGFSPGARVFIGGKPAPAAPQGPGTLAVTIPPGKGPGLVDVAVTNSDGQSDVLP
ncbi:MAG: IPT/TIG domain-containing protein, partial [Deltaproteobacteria bacterium]|nr:IPT/TIG domain-containing protein [Deltaproteobacteria bacterium]